MSFYQNFADGFHIKEKNINIKRILEIQNKFEDIRNNKALSFIKSRTKLLEIGSGRGNFAKQCMKKKIDYFGIEPEKTLFKDLKAQGFKIKNLRVPPLPYNSIFFDYITHFHVIEHLINGQEVYHFFAEANRVLKKNGKMIFRCPNAKTWGFDFWDIDYTHSFFTSPRRIEQILYDTGFTIDYFEEFSFLKPYHFGGLAKILAKIKILDAIYPKISFFLGKLFKKNTELLYICLKR